MIADAFAAFLHALPFLLGGALVLFVFVGFWRGLSLRPHDPQERKANPLSPVNYFSGPWGPAPDWIRRLLGFPDPRDRR